MCQLHLDFHTSPAIDGVAGGFDASEFADRLGRAGIESVTVFAKCHHSLCYYPTRVGTPHPGLAAGADGMPIDLLGRQIEACHARGIRCPVYLAVGWSEADAARRPDWRVYDADGSPRYSADTPAHTMTDSHAARPHVAWSFLDVGNGSEDSYGHHVLQLVHELCDRYPLDGLFLDICTPVANFGVPGRGEAEAQTEARATAETTGRWLAWARCVEGVLHARHPRASLFFNGLAEADTPAEFLALQTHLEIEDLPGFWGGFDKFPIRARRLAARPGAARRPMVAMSGRFHTMWGEFGGYKHPDALRIEALMMAAHGCRCSFGDQLPPSGVLDEESLARLAPAMAAVRALEPYVDRARFSSSLAICHDPRSGPPHGSDQTNDPIQGIGDALLQLHQEFTVVSSGDLAAQSGVRAILLPDAIVDATAAANIAAFAERGGRVLLIGPAAIESAIAHGLPCGVSRSPRETFDVDYITPAEELAALARGTSLDVSHAPVLCYDACPPLRLDTAKALAHATDPYFSRTVSRFCSHRHSPPDPAAAPRPAITVNAVGDGAIYCLAHAWGEMYRQWGMRLHRDLLGLVLRHAHPAPTVEASLPSAARISLLRQDHLHCHVLHVIYAPPIKRGCVEVLEDFPELLDASVTLNLGHTPRRAWTIDRPQRPLVISEMGDGRIKLDVPAFAGHSAIVLED